LDPVVVLIHFFVAVIKYPWLGNVEEKRFIQLTALKTEYSRLDSPSASGEGFSPDV
jgi:hypothetical protein